MKTEELAPNQWRLTDDRGRTLILVGTAHIGQGSIDAVASAIETHQPDAICVELDEDRLKTLENPKPFESLDIVKIIRSGKTFLFAGHLILSAYQKKLAQETGTNPGDEMRKAVALAREKGVALYLVDRHVQTTLRRLWNKAGFWGQMKLLSALLGGSGDEGKVTDIEKLKERDALDAMLEEMGARMPVAKAVLIDERDRYLATRIAASMGTRTVAVVGAGHLKGILKAFEAGAPADDLAALDEIPKGHKVWTILGWTVSAIIIAFIIYGIVSGRGRLTTADLAWVFGIRMAMAGLGATAALAHPLAILAGILWSPIAFFTRINTGLVAGLVQAWAVKPTVSDFGRLGEDAGRFPTWYRNRVTKVLLVAGFTALGTAISNLTFVAMVIKVIKG